MIGSSRSVLRWGARVLATSAALLCAGANAESPFAFRSVSEYLSSTIGEGREDVTCVVVSTLSKRHECEGPDAIESVRAGYVYGFVRSVTHDSGPSQESSFVFVLRASPSGRLHPVVRSKPDEGGWAAVFEFRAIEATTEPSFVLSLMRAGRASEPVGYAYRFTLRNGQWVVARNHVHRVVRCDEGFVTSEAEIDYLKGLQWTPGRDACAQGQGGLRRVGARTMPLSDFVVMDNDPAEDLPAIEIQKRAEVRKRPRRP